MICFLFYLYVSMVCLATEFWWKPCAKQSFGIKCHLINQTSWLRHGAFLEAVLCTVRII